MISTNVFLSLTETSIERKETKQEKNTSREQDKEKEGIKAIYSP